MRVTAIIRRAMEMSYSMESRDDRLIIPSTPLGICFLFHSVHGQIYDPLRGSGSRVRALAHTCHHARTENVSYDLHSSRIFQDERYEDLAMKTSKEVFFQVPPYLQLLGPNQAFCDCSTKISGFLQEAGGLASALVFSTIFSICFRFLHFLSEEISTF